MQYSCGVCFAMSRFCLVMWLKKMIHTGIYFVLLLQIVNTIFAPFLTEGMTVYLKHPIVEHHQLFKYLFPVQSLLPKRHFMIHYPRCIKNIGPLIHMWCMRYEGKHNFFKRQLKCYKNLTLSLAKKHQNHIA